MLIHISSSIYKCPLIHCDVQRLVVGNRYR